MRYTICTKMQNIIFQNIETIPDYKMTPPFFGVAKKILQNVSVEAAEGRAESGCYTRGC